ncbi:hypothetical protein [Mucilaginibacter ginsenosidivorax]|uniref:Uncharacterized protein n=1 Tax=Mucilaginibacter ginsenosidivorax TaxID=862126 RepID=A0A5B8VUH6_9SPHI|nr:hypothetical protein [Mucilaginibacter ginsenosidivorax]QEC74572.1 hypothetical protein FSB76_00880 [Mucilaginibacter ginsenosidivorax]
MKHNLNDPDSYESVDYTQLDSLFINPGVKKMADELLEISNDHDQYNKIIRAEKHKFSGFSLIHTFRVKNGTGGIETYTWQFNFNSTLENIYNIEKSGYH